MAVTLRDAEALVGLPYRAGRADCMHLAVLAQRQLFGRVVRWPADARHPLRAADQVETIGRHLADLARPLQPCEPAITGDAVLWQAGIGSDAQHWHIGTLFVALGERWVLHTTAALGASVLQPLAECGAQGLHFEGFYRWL